MDKHSDISEILLTRFVQASYIRQTQSGASAGDVIYLKSICLEVYLLPFCFSFQSVKFVGWLKFHRSKGSIFCQKLSLYKL